MRDKFSLNTFPKPRRSCSQCHKEFEPHGQIHSTVCDDAVEKIERIDCCPECFEQSKDGHMGAHWKLIKPEERVNKKLSWKELDERAFLLLDEALANPTPEAQQEAALLCMHLLRRKKLVLDKVDHQISVYRIPDTGATMTLPKACALTSELQLSLQKKLFAS